jgi:hypothetical protein
VSTVTLRPMTDAEFAGFRSAATRAHADELAATGGWPAEEALERAQQDSAELLPQGRDTPGMQVFSAVLDDAPQVVPVVFAVVDGTASSRPPPRWGWTS